MFERLRRRARSVRSFERPVRLHVGSGAERLDGWVNVDIQRLPGVDVVADVTEGLPFEDGAASALYAEHFIEHLRLEHGLDFLVEAHRLLRVDGSLRLSTPNLDWVWETHYDPDAPAQEKVEAALRVNRAFHGWGHQFLWNPETLARALTACGFDDLSWCGWGESSRPEFERIERHRAHRDTARHQHVVIVEAVKGAAHPELLADLRQLADQELFRYLGPG